MGMTTGEREALIEQFAAGYDAVIAALDGITGAEWEAREAPGEWSPRQIVHHLCDGEMNAAARIRFLIAEQQPVIMSYDQDRWTEMLYTDSRPIEPSLAALKAAREATTPLLRLITDAQWGNIGSHSAKGQMTAEDWLSWYGPHAHDHADQIRRARAAAE